MDLLSSPEETALGLPPNPHASDLPARQHALNDFLRTDGHGNPLSPRHHAILLLELRDAPSADAARTVERAMRTLDAAYEWLPDGLFHVLAWGPRYFSRIDEAERAPVRPPSVISRTDKPRLENFDAALVLSSDAGAHLRAAENAMFGSARALNGETVEHRLGDVFTVAGRRTGFIGEGLPARHASAEGIPHDAPITAEMPMFTGFFSGRKRTQATEDRVTIPSGEFAGGTTAHLSHLRLSLEKWYDGLDEHERVQRMFSASLTPDDVEAFTDDVPLDAEGEELARLVRDHAREFDVVGHHEKVAQTRRGGQPVILRRDFNTVDGGRAGVHFLSYQADLQDFVKTRKAMNGWYVRDDSPAITDRNNNGLLDIVSVASRNNFYVPPREKRSFPLF